MVVTDITATQCLHERSEQMKAKSEELDTVVLDQTAHEILNKVKPLSEVLQVSTRQCSWRSALKCSASPTPINAVAATGWYGL